MRSSQRRVLLRPRLEPKSVEVGAHQPPSSLPTSTIPILVSGGCPAVLLYTEGAHQVAVFERAEDLQEAWTQRWVLGETPIYQLPQQRWEKLGRHVWSQAAIGDTVDDLVSGSNAVRPPAQP
jgi:hypothetical protein